MSEHARTGAGLTSIIEEDLQSICDRGASAIRSLAGKTVLVAGGAGFLPSYVVDVLATANQNLLSDQPCRVLALDNMQTGLPDRLAHLAGRDDVVLLAQDIVQPLDIDEPVHAIFHGASIASPTWYRQFPLETIDVNVTGTRNLLELTRTHPVEAFLYLSSSEVYGDPPPEQIPTREEYWGHVSSTGPRACYDESKRLAEALCMTYHRLHGTPVKLVRPFNVYGPRIRLDDGRVIPDFVRDALDGGPITVLSDGRVTRSFCYIADFVAGAVMLMVDGRPGEIYNLGTDEEVSIREAAEVAAALGAAEVVLRVSEDPDYLTDNPNRRSPDLTKTKAAIPWTPTVDLRTGLERTFRHYVEQRQP